VGAKALPRPTSRNKGSLLLTGEEGKGGEVKGREREREGRGWCPHMTCLPLPRVSGQGAAARGTQRGEGADCPWPGFLGSPK